MLYNLTLLFPCFVCLFGAAWMLCKIKSNTRAQNMLLLSLLFSSVFFFCTANYILGVNDYTHYIVIDIIDSFITPLVIPTMYLYYRATTHEGHFNWKDYVWFMPTIIVGIGTCILYMAMDKTEIIGYIQSILVDKNLISEHSAEIYKVHRFISVDLYNLTVMVQILGAGSCAVINLKYYHNRLKEFYSDVNDKSMDIDNKILFWFMLTIPFALGIIIPKRTFWQQYPIFASLYFIVWGAAYFAIFYYDCQKKYSVENMAKDIEDANIDEAHNNNTQIKCEEDLKNNFVEIIQSCNYTKYRPYFDKLMDEEHVYINCSLRADEVASRMCTNRTYLSRMIKEEFGCTFSDYINRKRIEHSQILMRDNPNIRISELAEQSGFTNINSFGRTFKQIMGVPPKEWFRKYILDC